MTLCGHGGEHGDGCEKSTVVVERKTHEQPIFFYVAYFATSVSWEELLASNRESVPGPDGLTYCVYRSAGGTGSKFLFAAYQACLQGVALPG